MVGVLGRRFSGLLGRSCDCAQCILFLYFGLSPKPCGCHCDARCKVVHLVHQSRLLPFLFLTATVVWRQLAQLLHRRDYLPLTLLINDLMILFLILLILLSRFLI